VFGELQQRHSGDADGLGRNGINVCGMERRLLRHGNLLGDDEFSEGGHGDIQYHTSAVCLDRYRSGDGQRNGDEQSDGN